MLIKEATALVAGLANPSKMPGKAYGLPAKECKVGSKLRAIKGSTCEGCYALKGQYRFRTVQAAQYRRLDTITTPAWVDAMVTLISRENWFRWHDSGDLQSVSHLLRIMDVCDRTPNTKHWLPTRENQIVKIVLATRDCPANLIIRISDAMVDALPVKFHQHTSGVTTDKSNATCPAYQQGGECNNCRKCWDKSIPRVIYPKH